jgi:hypothetical protein
MPTVKFMTPVDVTLSADSLLLIGAVAAWGIRALWTGLIRNQVVHQLEGAFAPVEEERLLGVLVTQIGGLAQASRVMLGAFHNSTVDETGYHYTRITAVNTYLAPGVKPMQDQVVNLPLGRIMLELEAMIRSEDQWVHFTLGNPDVQIGCRNYLERNDIYCISSRLIRVGNLPIGILSVQWDHPIPVGDLVSEALPPHSDFGGRLQFNPSLNSALNHAVGQIAQVMRRRVIQPSQFTRLRRNLKALFSGAKDS